MIQKFTIWAAIIASVTTISSSSYAFQLAISQYGRVTATLPWAVAMEKGYFDDAGIKIDQVIAGAGGGTTLRNVLASDLPYGEVATSAAIAASRAGLDVVIVNTSSSHIGEIALVADAKSDIHKMADLAGKKAGYTAPKSTSDVLLRLALKETQMTGKVETVATGGFGPGITALTTGAIAAAPMIDPILTLQPEKYRVILPFADVIPRMTWLVGASIISIRIGTPRCRSTPKCGSRIRSRSRPISPNTSVTKANGRGVSSKKQALQKCRRAWSSPARSKSLSTGMQ
jgi:NitT/TauT family transport system substrate-binding protein